MSINRWLRMRGAREIVAIGAYVAVYLAWQVFRWGGPGDRETIGDLSIIPISVAAALAAWRAGHHTTAVPGLQRGWRLIAGGLLFFSVGDVAQAIYELILHLPASPSPADPAYLLFYPMVLVGVLSFPTVKPVDGHQRAAIVIDLVTVAIAGGAAVWYLLLGPHAFTGARGPIETLLVIAYPVGDFLLICALAHVIIRRVTTEAARTLYWLGLGLLAFVVGDLAWGWMSINSIYTGGDWVDVPYVISMAIFAVAAIRQPWPNVMSDSVRSRRSGVAGVLPYLAPLLVLGLVALADRERTDGAELILIVITAVLLLLAVIRQFVAQRQVNAANQALGQANVEIRALAETDALTGLPNHRAMVAALDVELERSARFQRNCAVLFIDVDHFKSLNDTLGHAAGDEVLRETGRVLRSAVRTIDTIGRWGGEEFVAIVPEAESNTALATALRVGEALRSHRFGVTGGRPVTCSIGVAAFPRDGVAREALLDSADRAMYAAKRAGRDQACRASGSAGSGERLSPAAA